MGKREWWDIPEEGWLQSTEISTLYHFLAHRPDITDRKWLLFALGCAQSVFPLLDERCRNVLHHIERFADGPGTAEDLEIARRLASQAYDDAQPERKWRPPEDVVRLITMQDQPLSQIAGCVESAVRGVIAQQAWKDAQGKGRRYQDKMRERAWQEQGTVNLSLFRCVFHNPFRPLIADARWLTNAVVALAAGIYDDRAFDRLPILADALEEAGCTDADILGHSRGPGPHVRGCWVIDLLLGKK
jgi:hypothetical protein